MAEETESLEVRAERLSKSLEESKEAYCALLELEREQGALIESSDLEGVAERISLKQALLESIQGIDDRLHREHRAWQEVRESAPIELRERLQEQVEGLRAVMARILDLQQSNEQNLRLHGEELSGKLREIQQRKSAHRGYQQRAAKDAYARSKFYDRSS